MKIVLLALTGVMALTALLGRLDDLFDGDDKEQLDIMNLVVIAGVGVGGFFLYKELKK